MIKFPSSPTYQLKLIALLGQLRGILDVLCEGWTPSATDAAKKNLEAALDVVRKIYEMVDDGEYPPIEDFDEYCRKKE